MASPKGYMPLNIKTNKTIKVQTLNFVVNSLKHLSVALLADNKIQYGL